MTWPDYNPLTAAWNWLATLAGVLTDPGSPFWWPTIVAALVAFVVAGFVTGASLREMRQQAMPAPPRRFLRQMAEDAAFFAVNAALPFIAAPAFFLLSASGAAIGYSLMAPIFGTPAEGARLDHPVAIVLITLLPFMAGDFSLYWSHRLFHRYPLLWRAHRLHHAPEVLTPLTAFRFWPQEQVVHIGGAAFMSGFALGVVSTAMGAAVTPLTLLGVNAFSLVWNLAFSHLRHSHVALPFPRLLSYILVSPHMHQAHHSRDAAQHDKNFATVFALWDWMFGTLYLPARAERFRFGLAPLPTEPAATEAPPEHLAAPLPR